MLLFSSAQAAVPPDQPSAAKQSTAAACTPINLDFHESTDVNAFRNYDNAIADLLKQENFDQLDCLAEQARSQKARFSGGGWKISEIYSGLELPQPGQHATQEDWNNHLSRLNRWVSAKPDSITARIALAKASVSYAWDARGNGYSGTVSESGWKLLYQRLEEAKSILNEAAQLKTKCPEWYVVMQQIALGEEWQVESARALLEKAIAFEPQYHTYYQAYAYFMLPKWHGEDGDVARFAEEMANKLGGPQGDALYFWIAAKTACPCDEPEFQRLSFPRMQRGFEQLEKRYGQSIVKLNLFALMAVRADDAIAADAAFQRIGDSWDRETWKTEKYFNQSKRYAETTGPYQAHLRSLIQEATDNGRTPEGARYETEAKKRIDGFMQQCLQHVGNGRKRFDYVFEVSKTGAFQFDISEKQLLDPLTTCLVGAINTFQAKNHEPAFPPPPFPRLYLVKVELDPAAYYATAQ